MNYNNVYVRLNENNEVEYVDAMGNLITDEEGNVIRPQIYRPRQVCDNSLITILSAGVLRNGKWFYKVLDESEDKYHGTTGIN